MGFHGRSSSFWEIFSLGNLFNEIKKVRLATSAATPSASYPSKPAGPSLATSYATEASSLAADVE